MNPAAAANVGLRRAAGPLRHAKGCATPTCRTKSSPPSPAAISTRTRCIAAIVATSALSAQDLQELEDDSLLAHLESLDSTRHSRMPHPPQWYIRDLHTNACGDFLLMSGRMWHTVRGFPLDSTVLSLDCDSLLMHTAAALGSHEICLPPSCRIFKGRHGHLFTHRITQVWSPWQSKFDRLLANSAGGGCRRSCAACSTTPGARCSASKAFSARRSSATSSSPPNNGPMEPSRTLAAGKLGFGRPDAGGKNPLPGRVGHRGRHGGDVNIEQAVFLVGGLGSRLRGLTSERAKPMLDVGGRPFLDYLLDEASRYGIKRALLLCGYRAGDLVAGLQGTHHSRHAHRYGCRGESCRHRRRFGAGRRPPRRRFFSRQRRLRFSISTGWPSARRPAKHRRPGPHGACRRRRRHALRTGRRRRPEGADFHRLGRLGPADQRRRLSHAQGDPVEDRRGALLPRARCPAGAGDGRLDRRLRRRGAVHRYRHPGGLRARASPRSLAS